MKAAELTAAGIAACLALSTASDAIAGWFGRRAVHLRANQAWPYRFPCWGWHEDSDGNRRWFLLIRLPGAQMLPDWRRAGQEDCWHFPVLTFLEGHRTRIDYWPAPRE